MSKKSETIAARRLALNLRVISNDPVETDDAPSIGFGAQPASKDGGFKPRANAEPPASSGFSRNRIGNNKPAEPVVLDTSLAGNFHGHGGIYPAQASQSSKDSPRIGFGTALAGVPDQRDYPQTRLTVVSSNGNSDTVESAASVFATWLEGQYHGNVAPFAFLGDVPLQIEDMPAPEVVEMAIKMLRARGWQVSDLIDPRTSGRSVGSIVLMHPDSVGY